MTVDPFEEHRGLLTGVAYRVLGRVADAEDVVQDAWLRWSAVDRSDVAQPRAYLVTVVTRLAIDRLRRESGRRETYVGPWLPEPLLTAADTTSDEARDSISIAMLVVLETLSPLERAAFVLHDVFGFTHPEIAAILERSEPAVRQLARRAREHVRQRRPRFEVDRGVRTEITQRFIDACRLGDIDALLAVLAPDVVLIGDGGGIAKAPRRPLHGRDDVARFLLAIASRPAPDLRVEVCDVNGGPGIVVRSDDGPLAVFVLDVWADRVQTIHAIANPEKLGGLG